MKQILFIAMLTLSTIYMEQSNAAELDSAGDSAISTSEQTAKALMDITCEDSSATNSDYVTALKKYNIAMVDIQRGRIDSSEQAKLTKELDVFYHNSKTKNAICNKNINDYSKIIENSYTGQERAIKLKGIPPIIDFLPPPPNNCLTTKTGDIVKTTCTEKR
ncbi:MAG: hypothetical protein ACAH10_10870 [Methylophilaceae bacterium]